MNASASDLAEIKAMLAGMAKEAADLKQVMGDSVTDAVADWLAPQYLAAAREKLALAEGARRWEVLRAIVQDWTVLRRGDHSAARLQLDREELDLQRANSEAQKEREFREWVKRPDIRAEFFPGQAPRIDPGNFETDRRGIALVVNRNSQHVYPPLRVPRNWRKSAQGMNAL